MPHQKNTIYDESSRREGGASWLVVFGVSIIQLTVLPIVHCFGLIYEHEFHDLGITTIQLSLLIHINSLVGSLLGLFCTPALHRFNYRIVAVVGCLLCCSATCLMSFADSWMSFMLTYGILYGMGQGILFPTTTLAISSHFKELRSLAIGLSVSVSSFGPVLSPSIVTFLFYQYGTFGTVLILGAVALNSIPGALLLRSHKLSRKNKKQDTENPLTSGEVSSSTCCKPRSGSVKEGKKCCSCSKVGSRICKAFDLDLLKDPVFVNIALGMAIAIASEYNYSMMLPFILVDIANLDKHALAFVMSIQAIADIISRTLVPFAASWLKFNARIGFLGSLMGSILTRIILAYFHQYYLVVLLQAIVFGSCKGFKAIFQSLVIPEHVPLSKLAAASGLYLILNGILSMMCGLLIGILRDISDSYVMALHGTSVLSSLCIIFWAFEYFWCKPKARFIIQHELIE